MFSEPTPLGLGDQLTELGHYSCPLARRESLRVMMDRLMMSVVMVLDRIMAKCGLLSPHFVSPHCFIAVGILNPENIE